MVNTLNLQNVSKRFGGLYAVRDVNLDVAHGERLGLIGPNGAGKTTLFNIWSGCYPDSGAKAGGYRVAADLSEVIAV
jgi:branched-chain amino acid transport system ATP-binding protein